MELNDRDEQSEPSLPPQPNLWVRFGSGRSPRLCKRASFATSGLRKPYDFLVTSFTLLFRPSTAPEETVPLARNQLSIKLVMSAYCPGNLLHRLHPGPHYPTRPFIQEFPGPCRADVLPKPLKLLPRRYARTVRRLYLNSSDSRTVCFSVRFSGRFRKHHRECFRTGS